MVSTCTNRTQRAGNADGDDGNAATGKKGSSRTEMVVVSHLKPQSVLMVGIHSATVRLVLELASLF